MKVKQLKTEHDIEVDGQIKVALLTGMLPADFQEYVFQWSDGKVQFKEVKEKVLTLAMNRASLGRPMPMEIDKCGPRNGTTTRWRSTTATTRAGRARAERRRR